MRSCQRRNVQKLFRLQSIQGFLIHDCQGDEMAENCSNRQGVYILTNRGRNAVNHWEIQRNNSKHILYSQEYFTFFGSTDIFVITCKSCQKIFVIVSWYAVMIFKTCAKTCNTCPGSTNHLFHLLVHTSLVSCVFGGF